MIVVSVSLLPFISWNSTVKKSFSHSCVQVYICIYKGLVGVFLQFMYLLSGFVIVKWYRPGILNSRNPFLIMVLELGNLRPAVARLAFLQGLSPWLADAVFPASFLGLPSEHIHVLISSYLDPSGFIFTYTPYLQIQ